MQIDNSSCNSSSALNQTTQAAEAQTNGTSAKAKGAQGSTSQTDGLQLSNFAGTLSQVLQSDSSSRSQRVAQLAAAVQSGTYQVNAQAVSKAIVDHAVSNSNSLP